MKGFQNELFLVATIYLKMTESRRKYNLSNHLTLYWYNSDQITTAPWIITGIYSDEIVLIILIKNLPKVFFQLCLLRINLNIIDKYSYIGAI